MNITPDSITRLASNEVFVYGSNTAGRHGAGAAKQALKWGAIYGRDGFAGQTYGISTKGDNLEILSLADIQTHVDRFTAFARSREDLVFLVTQVGCGLARRAPTEIAPLFKEASKLTNVFLPKSFWEVLSE